MDLPAEHDGVIKELARGRGKAAQLRAMLRDGQLDSVDLVIDEISDSFDRAINELSSSSSSSRTEPQHQMGSRRREYPSSEKRFLAKPAEDGYIWKKYGQKKILGAKYPRNYYRCSQHNDQQCQATKHVQRTDDGPMYQVTYIGRHSCRTLLHTSYSRDADSSPNSNCWLSFERDHQSSASQWQDWPNNFQCQNQESGDMMPDNTSVGALIPREIRPTSQSQFQHLDQGTGAFPSMPTYHGDFSTMPSSSSNLDNSMDSYTESPMDYLPGHHSPFDSF